MIKSIIKKRTAKPSKRGLYLQDRELKQTKFEVGTNFKYVLDAKKKTVKIVPTNKATKNTISKRTLADGEVKPVIDIRDKQALKVFEGAEQLEVVILESQVIVRGLAKPENAQNVLFEFKEYQQAEVRFEKSAIAAGQGSFHFSTSDSQTADYLCHHPEIIYDMPIALKAMSLFSGAGLMDFSFLKGMNEDIKEGEDALEIVLAIEKNEAAAETYRHNIGDHIICADINDINPSIYAESKATISLGGSPCQGFSNANRKQRHLDNPNNLLVRKYIEAIKANPHLKVFVWENVPQLLSSGGGLFLDEILEELSDFEISYGVLNAKDFGDAQDRNRAFLIGSKIGRIELPTPTTNEPKTVREAFEGLTDDISNQLDYSIPRQDTVERMKAVPMGGNWRDIPAALRNAGMKVSKTHANIFKRLSFNKPAISIVNPRKSLILHPVLNRILSVRECARLFSLPDNFEFKGALSEKQQQIANSTCVNVVAAVAKQVKKAIIGFNAICCRNRFTLINEF